MPAGDTLRAWAGVPEPTAIARYEAATAPGGWLTVAGWLRLAHDLNKGVDALIREHRADARAVGDHETSRACCAALGLPTGDGAGGLLDAATCRARIVASIGRAQKLLDRVADCRARAIAEAR